MYLLRHGQSLFNLHYSATKRDPGIADPELTPLGHDQAARAAETLADKPITRVIVSPYTRALQTAAAVLRVHDVPVEIMLNVRERYAFSCDVGTPPKLLAARFPEHEFSHLPEKWWPDIRESEAATIERARWFRNEMRGRVDAHTTLLVSHWAFILALTGVSAANGEIVDYDLIAPVTEEIVWRP